MQGSLPDSLIVKAKKHTASSLDFTTKQHSPKITIVTPSFNQGQFLEECIDSILSQNYPNLEYIIMDGGSTDASPQIIKKYEKYLTYWQSRPDKGHYPAVNNGFNRSTGTIMGWLNSDDKLHLQSLFKIAYIFSTFKAVDWVTGRITKWDKAGNLSLVADTRSWTRQGYLEGKYQWIQQESTFWKRNLWNRAGSYLDTTYGLAADMELWARFFRYTQLYSVNDFLDGYRLHGDQRGQRFMDKYLAEADEIIAREIALVQKSADKTLLPAPDSIEIDTTRFNQFVDRLLNLETVTAPASAASALPVENNQYLVSAIVSTYNAQRFIRGRLQNLVEQTLFQTEQLEIIVIDSSSPQNEGEIVQEFAANYPHIIYRRTAKRETVYGAWNRGIKMAHGQYVINANTDDRFAPNALEHLANALNANSNVHAAYGDWLVTTVENDSFDSDTDKFVFHYPKFTPPLLLYFQITTHAALLRKEVFDQIGYFNDQLQVLGDRELFLRFSAAGLKAQKIANVVGLYLESPSSLERKQGVFQQEFSAIRQKFIAEQNFIRLFNVQTPPSPSQLSQLYADAGALGKEFYTWHREPVSDFAFAAQLFNRALELDAANVPALNNLAIIACVENQVEQGVIIFLDALKASVKQEKAVITDNLAIARQGSVNLNDYHWLPAKNMPVARKTGFSFCIISGGQRLEKLQLLVDSIHAQNIPNYEIVVAGIANPEAGVTVIAMPKAAQSGQTSTLRNAAATQSQYSHIVFSDDDIILQPGWFAGLQPSLANYDILTTKLLNMDGTRHWDWAAYHPDVGQKMLDYGEVDENLYLTSGLLLVNAHVWETIGWNESLGFYDQEDVDFSKRALKAGFRVHLCPDSVALHNDLQYTQIGRQVWKRTSAGITVWANESLRQFAPQKLLDQAIAHLEQQHIADAADCLRTCLLDHPDFTPARQLWAELVQAFGGATDEDVWLPKPLPASAFQQKAKTVANPPSVLVCWEGTQFVTHSMALINREMCVRLAQEPGLELSLVPYEADDFGADADPRFSLIEQNLNRPLAGPTDVHIRHQWPPNFIPPAEGRWVMIQPWEFGSIPTRWIDDMRRHVDDVWAYSSYVRNCYIRSGMPPDRVHVVPPGVDVDKFHPDAPPFSLRTQKRLKFLFVGGTIERKGIDILLDVYAKTFSAPDDVCLVIKDMGGKAFYKGQTGQQLIAQLQALPDAPEIEYIDTLLSEAEIAGLYTACNCLVHPYRGEGFGVPIAEAMACGLPVIVTGHGAALDFCADERAYLIPAKEVRMSTEKRTVNHQTVDYPWWAEPDREVLGRLMRHVIAHPAETEQKARAAAAFIKANFTWEDSVRAVRRRLETLRRQPVYRLAAMQVKPETLVVVPIGKIEQPRYVESCLLHLERHQPKNRSMAVRLVKDKKISLDMAYEFSLTEASELTTVGALQAALRNSNVKYIGLLSPDTIVTRGWLDRLLAVAAQNPAVAAVGPTTNNGPVAQQITPGYQNLEEQLQKFATQRAADYENSWDEVFYLGGFCLLLNCNAVNAVGGLDENRTLSEALWNLYSRLRDNNFKLACAKAVYVHHHQFTEDEGMNYDNRPPKAEKLSTVLVQVENAQQAGNWLQAIDLLNTVLKQTHVPDDAALLWNRLGHCYVMAGQSLDAEIAFRQGLEYSPENIDLLSNLSNLYLKSERYAKGTEYLTRALQADPDDVDILLSLGNVCIQLGVFDVALMAFQRVKALAPETEGIDEVVRELEATEPASNLAENVDESDPGTVQESVELALSVGQAALKRGDLQAAVREFSRVVERYPNLAAGYTALGSTLLLLGMPAEAVFPLNRAIELLPQVAGNYNQLGIALFRQKQHDQAEAAFQQARQLDPNDLEPVLNLVDLYRSQLRYQEATEAIKEAMALDSANVEVLVSFGLLSHELGDASGAQMALERLENAPSDHPGVQALRQAVAASPAKLPPQQILEPRPESISKPPLRPEAGADETDTPRPAPSTDVSAALKAMEDVLAAGQTALKEGRLETAGREFAWATAQYPELAGAQIALGSTLLAMGWAEAAITPLRKAIHLMPAETTLHNQLGVALYQTGKKDEAEAAFQQAQQLDPANLEPVLNLVDLYRTAGRYEEATESIKTALKLNPKHIDVLVSFGLLSYELDDMEGAQMALKRLQAAPPDHPGVVALRQALTNQPQVQTFSAPLLSEQIEAAQTAGDWPKVINLLWQAVEHPQSPDQVVSLWNMLGFACMQISRFNQAEIAFKNGLEIAPQNLDLLGNMAEFYIQQEQYDKATGYINQALTVDPNDVNILLLLGNCSIQLGALDVALVAFKRVRTLAPNTEGVGEIIGQLEVV